MTFDATAGSSTANSFGSVEEADAYFDTKLYRAEWPATGSSGADLTKKQSALIEATRVMETLKFKGIRSNPLEGVTQRLSFPRTGIWKEDRSDYFDQASVPDQVKEAQFELALQLLKADPTGEVSEELKQFKRLEIAGAIKLEMRDPLPQEGALPASVKRLLGLFLDAGNGIIRLVRA